MYKRFQVNTWAIQKLKNVCAYIPRTCFVCRRSLVSGVQCDVEKCLMELYVGPCHVVSAEIAVVMAVPIENPADYCSLLRRRVAGGICP